MNRSQTAWRIILNKQSDGVRLYLAIAVFKAALVLYFFMRIGKSRPIVRIAAAAGIVWLALLCGLALSDVLFRS